MQGSGAGLCGENGRFPPGSPQSCDQDVSAAFFDVPLPELESELFDSVDPESPLDPASFDAPSADPLEAGTDFFFA